MMEAPSEQAPTAAAMLGRLPPEILQFFSNPGGHSLLIKGQAGTGKTTFALQLLESLFGFERNFYLSSRVSDRTLLNQFPWLVERERTERLLSASRQFLSAIHGPEGAQHERDAEKADLRHAKVFLRELTVLKGAPAPDVVDRTEFTRVGGMFDPQETPEGDGEEGPRDFSAYHSLMVDFDSDMPEIERAYERVENGLPNQICVAIDSIEALAEKYGIPATRLVTMLQKDLVENTNTHVVIVIEAEGPTALDYLVDGVVSLQFRKVAERQIREIAIQKMRGCVLTRPRYAFTLAGGRMTALLPAAADLAATAARWEPVAPRAPAPLSSGSPDLDELIGGGYGRGTVNLLEVGRGVPNDIVTLVGLNVAANFLSLGNAVFWLPTRDLTGPRVRAAMAETVDPAAVEANLRVVEITSQPGREHPAWLLPAERDRISDYLRWDMIRHLVKAGRPPALHITSYDALESRHSRTTEDLSEHYASIKEQGNVDLSIVKSSVDVLGKVADFATVHLRLESIDGTVVLMGEKPHTGVFHVGLPPRGHAPRLQLTAVV